MEWKEVRLGDVCTRVCSGGTPKSTNLSYYGGEIPWLNTKEIDFNRIYSTEKTITDSGLNNSSAKWIPKNCVIVEEIIGPTEYPIVPAAIKILMYLASFLPLNLTTKPVA